MCLLCSGCNSEQSKPFSIYKSNEECYYSAVCEIDVPALDDFLFFMPVVTDRKCNNLQNLSFYSKGENLNILIDNLEIYDKLEDLSDSLKETAIDGYRYELGATLNKSGISDKLEIDEIIARIDGIDYTFHVDIKILYKYIQEVYRPYNFLSERAYIEGDSLIKVINFTPSFQMSGAKIIQAGFKTISDNKIVKSKIKPFNGSDNGLGSLSNCINFTLEGSQSYTIYMEISDIEDYFLADNLYITVSYEGREYEYCSDINKMFGDFYSAQLCDITRVYFNQ